MKKPILISLALAALLSTLALVGCNGEEKRSLAVVDAEKVFQESKLASSGMQRLETLNADMQTHLAKLQEQFGATPEDKALEQKLQAELFALQGNMDQAQRDVAERVNKLFDEAVEQCRKEQGLDLVLPRQLVMALNPDVDITAKVVALMDKTTVDFSDISLDGGVPAEADGESSPAPGQDGEPAQVAPAEAGEENSAVPAQPEE